MGEIGGHTVLLDLVVVLDRLEISRRVSNPSLAIFGCLL